MSLTELTRNAFQSGLSASKWLSLCKLFISKELGHASKREIETDLSNSVLVLFSNYPGDIDLQLYLKQAVQTGTLSLSTFVSTFLSAARSREFHNPATLNVLCRTILECFYALQMPARGSIVPFDQPITTTLGTVHDAMALLRTVHTLRPTQFHHLAAPASELLYHLLHAIPDVLSIPSAQAMMHFVEASDMLNNLQLSAEVRQMLEGFVLQLSLLLGDDAKAAREAQMMHNLQLAFGRSEIVGSSSERDIVTCSLLLNTLVTHRADDFGSGDGDRAVVLLIALIRWTSWNPTIFYTQLLHSAVTCLSQILPISTAEGRAMAQLWHAFVVGRLPHLLSKFEVAVDLDGTSEADWKPAMYIAVTSLLSRSDLLQKCDALCQLSEHDHNGTSTPQQAFMSELLHGLLTVGLVDEAFVSQTNPLQQNEFHSKIQAEAQEHSSDVEPYLESKLTVDTGMEDIKKFIEKVWQDPCSHSAFAELAQKRFVSSATGSDLESLGHLCKILYTHEHALEILSLHTKLAHLVAHALIILEDYDCESVGDPQTAVTHIGDIVLFLQIALGRYHLTKCKFTLGERTLTADLLSSAGVVYRLDDLKGEDLAAFNTWNEALFGSRNEGIEDSVLRSTRPRSLLRIAATVLCHAIQTCAERKMEKSVLDNGVQYFLGPLLIWTVGGVIRALVTEMRRKISLTPLYVDVIQSLLNPASCPQPLLRVLANSILGTIPKLKSPTPQTHIRKVALAALGKPTEEAAMSLPPTRAGPGSNPTNPVLQAVHNALASARAGKAPYLDIDRCLHWMNPTRFLHALWAELTVASTMGELEAPRRIATYILTTPQASRSPPLLPIFLHLVMPKLIASADQLPPQEQSMAAELLISVVSSALTGALYIEWALLSACKEQRVVLGQPALAMARRLGGDLRRKKDNSPTSKVILDKLSSSGPFMTNFPNFTAEH